MAERAIMKGNEALAEAALRAGCRFYSGYPITPQTEILEYLSWRIYEDDVKGQLVQTEDELTGVHMACGAAAAGARVLSSSSGPGFSLYQEGMSIACALELPIVVIDVQRVGNGLGGISASQGDYELITRGNGNGDTMVITLAPASVQENVDMVIEAYDIAEKYRQPVIILSDAVIGQMMEGCELPDMQEHDLHKYDWYLRDENAIGAFGNPAVTGVKRFGNAGYVLPGGFMEYQGVQQKYFAEIQENEQQWESINVEDADVVLVGIGCSSRVAKEAIKKGAKEGLKLGLIRPKTVVPFPTKAFEEIGENCKGLLDIEMNTKGQMVNDIKLASKSKYPVYTYLSVQDVPDADAVLAMAKKIIAGEEKEERTWQ